MRNENQYRVNFGNGQVHYSDLANCRQLARQTSGAFVEKRVAVEAGDTFAYEWQLLCARVQKEKLK